MPTGDAEIRYCDTPTLRIGHKVGGPEGGTPVLLLHGWPDDATTWNAVAPALQRAGTRTFAPWLRGFGPTRFLADDTFRSGEIAALAQDALDFADALGLERFAIVGHDWGARVAYLLASVVPERVTRCVAMSVAWSPGALATPAYEQAKAYWYQWFMATDRGAAAVRHQGKAFARFQWESWGPPGWFEDALFDEVARSFENPAWPDVTLHSYRVRWGEAEPDPRYAELAKRQREARNIAVPTLLIQGTGDRCLLQPSTNGMEKHFVGPFRRELLAGVGHFPTREAPDAVSESIVQFLG